MCFNFGSKIAFIIFLSLSGILQTHPLYCQADSISYNASGYLKNMQSVVFPGNDLVLMENLIHHRLNFRIDFDEKWSFHVGLRNRVFAGNLTGMNDSFGQQLQAVSDDWLPLSVLWMERSQYAIHSTLDRFYTEWNHKNLNIRAGRQRVNWGQNIAFNPNDLFNVYNFLDFDYEERPGTDAIRVQYYTGFASGLDVVIKGGKDRESMGIGGRWFFNANEYDMQLIGGLANGDIALGGGWSGYLNDIGWKGELTWFHPLWDQDKKQAISASTGIDHSLGKGWFMYLSYLFNSDVPESNLLLLDPNRVLTARTIFPFKHSVLTQISYPITPLISASAAFIYAINENHPLILNPSLQLSLAENWDIDIIGQAFRPMAKGSELSSVGLWFLRVRWSY